MGVGLTISMIIELRIFENDANLHMQLTKYSMSISEIDLGAKIED